MFIQYTHHFIYFRYRKYKKKKNRPKYWCLKGLIPSKDLFLNDFANNFMKTALLLTQPHLYQIVGEQ